MDRGIKRLSYEGPGSLLPRISKGTMAGGGTHGGGAAADPVVTRYVEQDKVPWYSKPNLRTLYFLLLPTCMGVEMTSGYVAMYWPLALWPLTFCRFYRFDSSMMNGLQGVAYWDECKHVNC
jgi:hypothetical protein